MRKQSPTPCGGSLLSFKPGQIAEFEWADEVAYIGATCSNNLDDFEHNNMAMLRQGRLHGAFTKGKRPDIVFCRNGTFEVLVREDIANKLKDRFPGVAFNDVKVVGGVPDSHAYVELDRPMYIGIDMAASGYVFGRRCPICGFNEVSRLPNEGLRLDYVRPETHVATAWQNPFLTIVSEEFAEYITDVADGCFSFQRLESFML